MSADNAAMPRDPETGDFSWARFASPQQLTSLVSGSWQQDGGSRAFNISLAAGRLELVAQSASGSSKLVLLRNKTAGSKAIEWSAASFDETSCGKQVYIVELQGEDRLSLRIPGRDGKASTLFLKVAPEPIPEEQLQLGDQSPGASASRSPIVRRPRPAAPNPRPNGRGSFREVSQRPSPTPASRVHHESGQTGDRRAEGGGGGGGRSDQERLATEVKGLQKSNLSANELWRHHCDAHGKGVMDPGRHSFRFLEEFLTILDSKGKEGPGPVSILH
ncbi:unnamed protein product, partial [Polarella glacialis]